MTDIVYQCISISSPDNGLGECLQWQAVPSYIGYKLTSEQIAVFIFSIAALFATVAVIKMVRRTFF